MDRPLFQTCQSIFGSMLLPRKVHSLAKRLLDADSSNNWPNSACSRGSWFISLSLRSQSGSNVRTRRYLDCPRMMTGPCRTNIHGFSGGLGLRRSSIDHICAGIAWTLWKDGRQLQPEKAQALLRNRGVGIDQGLSLLEKRGRNQNTYLRRRIFRRLGRQ